MTVLEQITQMKNQGMPEEEIISGLREQGTSVKEIDDALNQAKIKSAISDTGNTEAMQPSIMQAPPPSPSQQDQGYTPQTQEIPEQGTYSPQPGDPLSQEFYSQDNYDNYSPSEGSYTDSMIEIAEQVFSEKTKKIQKQIENLNEFKILAETKIDNVSKRLQRIETTIDKLQISILEKVGSYGRNLSSIKKEMSMMQDSFGKVVNQAVRGHKSHIIHKTPLHLPHKKQAIKKISKKR